MDSTNRSRRLYSVNTPEQSGPDIGAYTFSLPQLLGIAVRRRLLIAGATLAGTTLAALMVFLQPPTYTAVGILVVVEHVDLDTVEEKRGAGHHEQTSWVGLVGVETVQIERLAHTAHGVHATVPVVHEVDQVELGRRRLSPHDQLAQPEVLVRGEGR